MTVFIDHHAVGRVLTYRDCITLLEEVFRHEAAGKTVVSPRLASSFRRGAMRILFAADHAHGFAATKAYHTVEGVGTRYLVSLIDLRSGALAALVDGRHITDFRTGGASGVVARRDGVRRSRLGRGRRADPGQGRGLSPGRQGDDARAALAAETAQIPADGMIPFKSVGSALQDLAPARHCYEAVRNEPGIPVLPDLHRGR